MPKPAQNSKNASSFLFVVSTRYVPPAVPNLLLYALISASSGTERDKVSPLKIRLRIDATKSDKVWEKNFAVSMPECKISRIELSSISARLIGKCRLPFNRRAKAFNALSIASASTIAGLCGLGHLNRMYSIWPSA